MNNFTIFLLVFIVIGLPVILGIGSSVFKDWIKHKERMATALNAQTAENASNSGYGCWSGSSPIAGSNCRTRSTCSATSAYSI